MNEAPDNITILNVNGAEHAGQGKPQEPKSAQTDPMDFGKIAIVVSLLSVVLSLIFFFGLNRNLSGLSNEVKDIGTIRNNVAALDSYVDDLLQQMGRVNTRIMELEDKPRKEAVRVLQESMINDMLRRSEFMEQQLREVAPDNTEQAQRLERLRNLLREFTAAPEPSSQ